MQWTESAEHDLEEGPFSLFFFFFIILCFMVLCLGLNRATHDLYAGIERARSEKPEDVHSAKEDLLKQVRRATVDIFKVSNLFALVFCFLVFSFLFFSFSFLFFSCC
jgi:hypothetical protein